VSWSPRQRRKNDVLFAAASAAIRAGLALPRTWLGPTGTCLGLVAYAVLGRERRATIDNIARAHPHLGPAECRALARATFRSLGRNLTDTLALLDRAEDPTRSLTVSSSSERVLAEALDQGRGVIYATCHLGPWERMAALLAHRGFPITTLARESYDARFHALVYDRLRARRNVQVIYRGQPSMPFAVVRALRRGRVLGMLLDMPGAIATQDVTWLGLPSRMPIGAARLALRLRCPVVVGTPAPHAAGLDIRITNLVTEDLAPGDRGEAQLSQRIADALSERIRLLPTHWPWMHPSFAPA
jgi:Kdo2-lipid IVA lauroyltransferase/acyltransferase